MNLCDGGATGAPTDLLLSNSQPHTPDTVTTWKPDQPCSVGALRLPAQFEPIWYVIYTGAQRGWICLPFNWFLSWNCETQEPQEVEVCRLGFLTLTRPATEQEQADWWDGYDPTP